MVVFSLLMVDDIIYVHFHSYYLFDLPQGILPFDYFFILFMIIMGSKLAGDLKQKAYLEGKNVHQQKRWQKLLEEVDLIVVELSDTGLVRYVNPYYIKLTGFNKEHVIGKKLVPGIFT
jgi:PAS domain-containing protein